MSSFRERVARALGRRSGSAFWRARAVAHGARAVLNLAHSPEEIEAVTERQCAILFPALRSLLHGGERLGLDFGCGTGRLSGPLADTLGAPVVAVDPTAELLRLAPPHPRVAYRLLQDRIPLPDASADVVFVCLVLGALVHKRVLRFAVAEITRVLKPGALLFVVDNTSDKPGPRHYRFRPAAAYAALFASVPLEPVGWYDDAGERISMLAGRKALTSDRLQG